jgi:YD repeat-containing protein
LTSCPAVSSQPAASFIYTDVNIGGTNAGGLPNTEQVINAVDAAGIAETIRFWGSSTGVALKFVQRNFSGEKIFETTLDTRPYYNYYQFIRTVKRDGNTWVYDGGAISNYGMDPHVISSADPQGFAVAVESDGLNYARRSVTRIVDELGNEHNFERDPHGRMTKSTSPEGDSREFSYDDRGNLLSVTYKAKPGSSLGDIVTSSAYPASCANPVTCNKPTSTTDPKSGVTNFTYDPVHGGVLTKTLPPDANGVRPQTRYSYAQRYAWLKNASGGYSQAATPVWVLISQEYCRTSAANLSGDCAAGPSDEVVTTYEYETGNAGKPSNLLLMGIAVAADGQTQRTCYGYDKWGRKISETKSRAGLTSCQ